MRITPSDMAYGGDAVGRDPESGRAAFVWPAITGEAVEAEIVARRANMVRGVVRQVVEPSPLRVEPNCPYFGVCGGCQWQHIAYEGQLKFKQEILASQLARIGGIANAEAILAPIIPSPAAYHYRNTSHFALHGSSHELSYFKREAHSLLPVQQCPISNLGINAMIPMLNRAIARAVVQAGPLEGSRGVMRAWQVAVRCSEATGHTTVVFHSKAGKSGGTPSHQRSKPRASAERAGRPDQGPTPGTEDANPSLPLVRRELRRACSDLGPSPITVIELMDDGTVNLLSETPAAAALSSESVADTMAGRTLEAGLSYPGPQSVQPPLGAWVESLAGLAYWVAPAAFFQVNTSAAELLLDEVRSHVPRQVDTLVDAHCGVGTFALALARHARTIVGFETDKQAVLSARWSASAHNVKNVEFREGRAEHLLPRLSASDRPDIVLLDPPRSGSHPDLLRELARRRVPSLIYVSCDPSTLARDVRFLADAYTLVSARVVDMFPQTYHLESVAFLGLRD